MHKDLESVIITQEQIARRVREIADDIAARHTDESEPIVVVTVLNGAFVFLADLIRQLPLRMKLGVIGVSSYPGKATSPAEATVSIPLNVEVGLEGKRVLIIDDILDSGNTLRVVQETVAAQSPSMLETGVLLRKTNRAPPDVAVDYVAFDVGDEFVVGYGLDFDGQYRNLPYIAVLKPELYNPSLDQEPAVSRRELL